MGRLTLILGGARSGKSTYAERLATQRSAHVAYIATAQVLDDEMAARIAMHKQKRPVSWQTLEIPAGVGQAIQNDPPDVDVIILDCLTLLVSNLLLQVSAGPDKWSEDRSGAERRSSAEHLSYAEYFSANEKMATAAIDLELDKLKEAIWSSPAEWIVVSNEVGMGLVPPYPLGRLYRDLLGWANQRMACMADRIYFMIAGIPMRLTPEP